MADDGRPRSARQVLEEIVQVLRASDSLDSRESSVGTNTTLQAQTNSSSITSVSQAVARLFPSVGNTVTRTVTSVPRSAKSRKRQNDSHCRRESGFFLKDVMLLPSPRITKIPRGKLRETLHLEGYAASAVEFGHEWSERKLRSALEAVFGSKLDGLPAPLFHFVRGIGDILVCPTLQPSQEFSAKVVKLLAKQGPIYIRAVQDIGSWKVSLACNETGWNMGLFC